MTLKMNRRHFAGFGAAVLATPMLARFAQAQDPLKIRFSAVFSEQDIRAEMMRKFVEGIGPGFAYDQVVPAVERILKAYLSHRKDAGEDFLQAYRRLGMEPFKAALYQTAEAQDAA